MSIFAQYEPDKKIIEPSKSMNHEEIIQKEKMSSDWIKNNKSEMSREKTEKRNYWNKYKKLTQNANLVFEGTVISKDYTLSEDSSLPLTFVTFYINKLIKGSYEGDQITLRFLGGVKGSKVMTVSHTPLFNINDRDILFVKGNGIAYSPIIPEGRIRIYEGNTFNQDGRQLLYTENDEEIFVGKVNRSEYFTRTTVKGAIFTRIFEGHDDENDVEEQKLKISENDRLSKKKKRKKLLSKKILIKRISAVKDSKKRKKEKNTNFHTDVKVIKSKPVPIKNK